MSSVIEELTEVIAVRTKRRDGTLMSDQTTAMLPASGWMTLLQASKLLGAHTNTVRRWADSGAIGSYRTLGGHRRLAERDVHALSEDGATVAERQLDAAMLDGATVGLIEATLRGEVSGRECRLRLRAVGRERGREAASAGTRLTDLLAGHAGTRRAIAGLVSGDGGAAATVDERQRWANSLSDALLMGLSEGIDTIPERVGPVRMRRAR